MEPNSNEVLHYSFRKKYNGVSSRELALLEGREKYAKRKQHDYPRPSTTHCHEVTKTSDASAGEQTVSETESSDEVQSRTTNSDSTEFSYATASWKKGLMVLRKRERNKMPGDDAAQSIRTERTGKALGSKANVFHTSARTHSTTGGSAASKHSVTGGDEQSHTSSHATETAEEEQGQTMIDKLVENFSSPSQLFGISSSSSSPLEEIDDDLSTVVGTITTVRSDSKARYSRMTGVKYTDHCAAATSPRAGGSFDIIDFNEYLPNRASSPPPAVLLEHEIDGDFEDEEDEGPESPVKNRYEPTSSMVSEFNSTMDNTGGMDTEKAVGYMPKSELQKMFGEFVPESDSLVPWQGASEAKGTQDKKRNKTHSTVSERISKMMRNTANKDIHKKKDNKEKPASARGRVQTLIHKRMTDVAAIKEMENYENMSQIKNTSNSDVMPVQGGTAKNVPSNADFHGSYGSKMPLPRVDMSWAKTSVGLGGIIAKKSVIPVAHYMTKRAKSYKAGMSKAMSNLGRTQRNKYKDIPAIATDNSAKDTHANKNGTFADVSRPSSPVSLPAYMSTTFDGVQYPTSALIITTASGEIEATVTNTNKEGSASPEPTELSIEDAPKTQAKKLTEEEQITETAMPSLQTPKSESESRAFAEEHTLHGIMSKVSDLPELVTMESTLPDLVTLESARPQRSSFLSDLHDLPRLLTPLTREDTTSELNSRLPDLSTPKLQAAPQSDANDDVPSLLPPTPHVAFAPSGVEITHSESQFHSDWSDSPIMVLDSESVQGSTRSKLSSNKKYINLSTAKGDGLSGTKKFPKLLGQLYTKANKKLVKITKNDNKLYKTKQTRKVVEQDQKNEKDELNEGITPHHEPESYDQRDNNLFDKESTIRSEINEERINERYHDINDGPLKHFVAEHEPLASTKEYLLLAKEKAPDATEMRDPGDELQQNDSTEEAEAREHETPDEVPCPSAETIEHEEPKTNAPEKRSSGTAPNMKIVGLVEESRKASPQNSDEDINFEGSNAPGNVKASKKPNSSMKYKEKTTRSPQASSDVDYQQSRKKVAPVDHKQTCEGPSKQEPSPKQPVHNRVKQKKFEESHAPSKKLNPPIKDAQRKPEELSYGKPKKPNNPFPDNRFERKVSDTVPKVPPKSKPPKELALDSTSSLPAVLKKTDRSIEMMPSPRKNAQNLEKVDLRKKNTNKERKHIMVEESPVTALSSEENQRSTTSGVPPVIKKDSIKKRTINFLKHKKKATAPATGVSAQPKKNIPESMLENQIVEQKETPTKKPDAVKRDEIDTPEKPKEKKKKTKTKSRKVRVTEEIIRPPVMKKKGKKKKKKQAESQFTLMQDLTGMISDFFNTTGGVQDGDDENAHQSMFACADGCASSEASSVSASLSGSCSLSDSEVDGNGFNKARGNKEKKLRKKKVPDIGDETSIIDESSDDDDSEAAESGLFHDILVLGSPTCCYHGDCHEDLDEAPSDISSVSASSDEESEGDDGDDADEDMDASAKPGDLPVYLGTQIAFEKKAQQDPNSHYEGAEFSGQWIQFPETKDTGGSNAAKTGKEGKPPRLGVKRIFGLVKRNKESDKKVGNKLHPVAEEPDNVAVQVVGGSKNNINAPSISFLSESIITSASWTNNSDVFSGVDGSPKRRPKF